MQGWGHSECPARPLQRGFPRNPLCPHPLPELPVGVTRASRSMTLPCTPRAPPHCTSGPAGGGRRVALQTRACPDRTCRAPVPGPRALAELHLPWARPPRAAYLALGCRPWPAHILLYQRRRECTARISYLMGRGGLPTSPSCMAQVTSPSFLCCRRLLCLSGFLRSKLTMTPVGCNCADPRGDLGGGDNGHQENWALVRLEGSLEEVASHVFLSEPMSSFL